MKLYQHLEIGLIELDHVLTMAAIPFKVQHDKIAIVVDDRFLFLKLQQYLMTDIPLWERGMPEHQVTVNTRQFEFMGWRFIGPR